MDRRAGACAPAEWDVVAALRTARSTRHIPVVLLTGRISPERLYRRRARELGCKAFVAKPCAPDVLAVTINRVLGGETGIEVMRGGQAAR